MGGGAKGMTFPRRGGHGGAGQLSFGLMMGDGEGAPKALFIGGEDCCEESEECEEIIEDLREHVEDLEERLSELEEMIERFRGGRGR